MNRQELVKWLRLAEANRVTLGKRIQRDYDTPGRVIGKAQTLTPAEQTACALPVRLAWEALRNGSATGSDYRSLADAIQICTAASEIDPFLEETCFAAAQALCGIADRYQRVGRLGVDAASLRDIPPALDFYEELLRTATAGQLFEWMQAVARAREGAIIQPPHTSPAHASTACAAIELGAKR